jgi:CubicO group peptidase (beta-lactamase class C family)
MSDGTPSQLDGFADWIRDAMTTWKVPGLAVGVVKDGAVVFLHGFGVRDVEQALPVTPNTLFALASGTKAFTTMAMGMVADEGKLQWDAPVKEAMPSFRLHDGVATERLTPRDLVTHRSGLPRHDMAWYHTPFSRGDLMRRLQYLQPNKDIRTEWQYQNLMYMAAGYLVEHLTGLTWEDFVRSRIFEPLGMHRSNFAVSDSQASDDYALPYREKDNDLKVVPFYSQFAIGPAGSINTCVADMTRWLLLHLGQGEVDGQRLVSEAQVRDMYMPHMPLQRPSKYEETPYESYGLGWFVKPYRGQVFVEHGGNIDGFSTMTTLMPRHNIGVVALCNMSGSPLPWIVCINAYERLLGLSITPWSDRFQADKATYEAGEKEGEAKNEADRVPDTQPSHPLDAYVGEYEHPGYGTLRFELEDGALGAQLNAIRYAATHYHYDTWTLKWELWDSEHKATFATDVRGDIASIAVAFEPTVDDIVFGRVPPRALRERAYLERFTGDYELVGVPMSVFMKNDALWIRLPGQPEVELVPRKEHEFRAKRLSGLTLVFTTGDGGAVTEAVVSQSGSSFHAPRR